MSDYTKALNGLRHCINLDGLEPNDTRIRCHGCPYFTEPTRCGGILMRDAAAAIEELQSVLKEADKKQAYQHDCICELTAENEELQAENEHFKDMLEEIGENNNNLFRDLVNLQKQLPKRGEWITIRLNNGGSYTGCSCCEAPIPTDTMLDYIPESESKYCYSCGAKMEAQE